MKKIIYSIALLGLLAAGCTDTVNLGEITPDTPDIEVVESETSYLPISLLAAGGGGTRADAETPAPGQYESGTGNEAEVKGIRLYFFDSEKNAAQVRKNAAKGENGFDSFIDFDSKIDNMTQGNADPSLTVEKTISLMMQLKIDEAQKPEYVVALINPTAELKQHKNTAGSDNLSLAELEGIVKDFNHEGYEDAFLMSNSVYADKIGTDATTNSKINYTVIKKLYPTLQEATDADENDKTVIFVERVAARIDFSIKTGADGLKSAQENGYTGTRYEPIDGITSDTQDTGNIFFTGSTYKEYNSPGAAKNIFVEFLGWQVVSTPKKSRLLKEINPAWEDNLFQVEAEPWNVPAYHRSFWAVNPTLKSAKNADLNTANSGAPKGKPAADYDYYSYNEILKHPISKDKIYVQENAADPVPDGKKWVAEGHETKVIVAARLLDADGKAMPIVEYGLMYYQKDALLAYFADQLSKHFYYYLDTERQPLTKDDLTYETQYEHTEAMGVDIEGGYLAYVTLSETGKGKTWYRDIDGESEQVYSEGQVKAFIDGIVSNRLLIWEEGRTYYYVPVRHLGKFNTATSTPVAPGAYGVVRNHIYKVNLNSLIGLGTPVFDPDEIIYPEKPKHDDYLFAAEIKVLQWREVAQDYDFTW